MSDSVLVDTNILVYAYDADAGDKHTKARDVIEMLWDRAFGVLPTQVLAEFFITITRKVKQPLSLSQARHIIEDYRAGWIVFPTVPDMVVHIEGVEAHRGSF
jgi:predicted nucleic acid-binding protein